MESEKGKHFNDSLRNIYKSGQKQQVTDDAEML